MKNLVHKQIFSLNSFKSWSNLEDELIKSLVETLSIGDGSVIVDIAERANKRFNVYLIEKLASDSFLVKCADLDVSKIKSGEELVEILNK